MSGRAFIIGNGPSLRKTDMNLLRGETTYAMNRIHLDYDRWDWRPSHYVFVDYQTVLPRSLVMEELAQHIRAGEQIYIDRYLREQVYRKLKSPARMPENIHFLQICDRVGHTGGNYASPHAPQAWHLDEPPAFCKFASGLFTAMQIAVMEGYNPLYLIACDLGYVAMDLEGPDPNHMHPEYVPDNPRMRSMIAMTPEYADQTNHKLEYGHQIAHKSCKELGVQVFNAGVGGQLDVYPRVDFEELFS
jgi:hypothetical protein